MAFNRISLLNNSILYYAWGKPGGISKLLNIKEKSSKPEAELWMGAHPKAPSQIKVQRQAMRLDVALQKYAPDILGPNASHGFPFLFKILSIDQPLSIQAHPNAAQARNGWRRENLLKIPMDSDQRNFKDQNPKPEILCAISPFSALCGFRPISEIIALVKKVPFLAQIPVFRNLQKKRSLKEFISGVLTLSENHKCDAIREVQKAAAKRSKEKTFALILKLLKIYPEDMGVLSPLFLNLIELKPGQAFFLNPGELHSYLSGNGVELMGNSDNVLRGGLTHKHVDSKALCEILDFKPKKPTLLKPRKITTTEWIYHCPEMQQLRLSRLQITRSKSHHEPVSHGVQIMICLKGSGKIKSAGFSLGFKRGDSWLVPAAVAAFKVEGSSVIYKASAL